MSSAKETLMQYYINLVFKELLNSLDSIVGSNDIEEIYAKMPETVDHFRGYYMRANILLFLSEQIDSGVMKNKSDVKQFMLGL
jgi:hypothetical protein